MEKAFDRILRSITAPLSRPVEEVIDYCIEQERGISGCMDTGCVLADPDPAEGFSSELIVGLGVSQRGIRWRWGSGAPRYGYLNIPVHVVLVVLAVDFQSKMRTLRAISTIFRADSELWRSILGATSLEQAISVLSEFEESPIRM